ncbi:hypothetical protein Tco_0184489 [Tanacetum coccineum]
MTRSTVKRLTKPLDEPEREFQRLKRAAWRLQQNESLAIAGRNLFDDEASSSNNTRANPPTPPKTLHEHSHPNPFGFQNPITLQTKQTGRILTEPQGIHLGYASSISLSKEKRQNGLTEYLPLKSRHEISSYHDSLTTSFWLPITGYKNGFWYKSFTTTYLGITVGNSINSLNSASTLSPKKRSGIELKKRRYPTMGEQLRKEKGEDGSEWTIRSRFEEVLANFMLEKKSHTKGIGEMLDQHHKELHEQFSQILSTIKKSETPEPKAPTFAITTRSGVSTQDPPFPALFVEYDIFVQIKEAEKNDEDERLLSIFKHIHINLPFLEAMIHMPKGAKVLKDLLSHKEKIEKATSSVKLSEECSAIIQRSLPQKEGDLASFTLPCLIGPLAVKNALVDLGASINLMPHYLF